MRLLLCVLLLFGGYNFSFADSFNMEAQENDSTNIINVTDLTDKSAPQKEKSLEQQAEEIPVVFGQWWFWVGLFSIILFLKLVIFKK